MKDGGDKATASLRVLPDPAQTQLLVACTAAGARAVAAWHQWRAAVDFDAVDRATLRVVPLLYHNLRRAGVAEATADMGRYHGCLRKAWVERRRLLAGVEPMLARFVSAGIPLIGLKGLVLGDRYYPNGALRPAGDADVWVPRNRAAEAIDRLLAAGWRPAHGRPHRQLIEEDLSMRHGWEFYGPADACVDLHWRASSLAAPPEWDALLRSQAREFRLGGVEMMTLSATHHFYHVVLHGVTAGRAPTVHWAADAMMILAQGEVDEALLVETARLHRTGRLLACGLAWLRDQLAAPLSEAVLAQLADLPEAAWAQTEFAALVGDDAAARARYYQWARFRRWRALDVEWRAGSGPGAYGRYLRKKAGARTWTELATRAWRKWGRPTAGRSHG